MILDTTLVVILPVARVTLPPAPASRATMMFIAGGAVLALILIGALIAYIKRHAHTRGLQPRHAA